MTAEEHFVEVQGFDNIHELTMDERAEEGIEPPAVERLEQVTAPALVISADHDPPFMQEAARMMASRIPNARLVEIEGVDHVVNMRKPAEFNRTVLDFLDAVRV